MLVLRLGALSLKVGFLMLYRIADRLLSVGDSFIERKLYSCFLTCDEYAVCRTFGDKEVLDLAWGGCNPVLFYQGVLSIAVQRIKKVRLKKVRRRVRGRQLSRQKNVVVSIKAPSDNKAWSELSAQARSIIVRVELFYFIVGGLITVKRCLMVWFILDWFKTNGVLGRSLSVITNEIRESSDSVSIVLENSRVVASSLGMATMPRVQEKPLLSLQERGHNHAYDIIDPPRFHHYYCRSLFESQAGEIVGPDNHSTGFRCDSVG